MSLPPPWARGPVVLMRAHGDAVVGESVEQVIERTTRLAMLGEWNHLALLHGEPKYLTAEELESLQCRPALSDARLGVLRQPAEWRQKQIGVMEYWSGGVMGVNNNPVLQHSITPI